jgi:hypothetical protein
MNGHLLDTRVLLWWMLEPARLARRTVDALADRAVPAAYSLASLWEEAIKTSLRKPGFDVDPMLLAQQPAGGGFQRVAHLAGAYRPCDHAAVAAPRSLRSPAGGPGSCRRADAVHRRRSAQALRSLRKA